MGDNTEVERIAALEAEMTNVKGWVKSIDARLWALVVTTGLTAVGVIFKGHF